MYKVVYNTYIVDIKFLEDFKYTTMGIIFRGKLLVKKINMKH